MMDFYSSLGVLLCLLLVQKTLAACSRDNGKSGEVECVKFSPLHKKSHWSTCITNEYIQLISKGRHNCTDGTATYCLHQCMLEIHDVDPGNDEAFYEDCSCGENETQTTQQPTSTLDTLCLSPSGENCSFYKQCLEEPYQCHGTSVADAITYAEQFCNLYTDHALNISQTGQNWISAVRKCLQVTLVPILRPWANISCDRFLQMALRSHKGCYLSPYPGAPSICNLPVKDLWKIFWTLKSGFVSAFVESLEGVLDVLKRCQGKSFDNPKDIVKFKFNIERDNLKRDISPTLEQLDKFAGGVADAIAKAQFWRDSEIMWYAYSSSSSNTSVVSVEVLITNHPNSTEASDVKLNAVTERVVKAVKDGDLLLWNVGVNHEPIYVKQIKACEDFECQRTKREVTAPPERYISSAFGLSNFSHTFVSFLFMLSLFFNVAD